MFLINCPYCGERDQQEFKAGGAANLSQHWTDIENMALNRKQAVWFSAWTKEAREKFFIHINN